MEKEIPRIVENLNKFHILLLGKQLKYSPTTKNSHVFLKYEPNVIVESNTGGINSRC